MEFQKVTYEWLSKFEWDENRTQKIQYATDRKVEFQQDEYFEASEFNISEFHIIGWGYY